MQRFKWDLLPLEKENKLKIYKFEPALDTKNDLSAQAARIVDKAKAMGAKRMVIDSITAFSFWMDDISKIRYAIYVLVEELRKIDCTTVLACETTGGKNQLSRFGVEEFLVDGLVQLMYVPPHRSMFIRKMRGTNHDKPSTRRNRRPRPHHQLERRFSGKRLRTSRFVFLFGGAFLRKKRSERNLVGSD